MAPANGGPTTGHQAAVQVVTAARWSLETERLRRSTGTPDTADKNNLVTLKIQRWVLPDYRAPPPNKSRPGVRGGAPGSRATSRGPALQEALHASHRFPRQPPNRYLEPQEVAAVASPVHKDQGSGKTTLARNIAQAWKCIRVEALSVLEEHVAAENETGAMLQSLLVSGHSVPDELVTKLILEKIKSPEVAHFGYIITEMPSLSQDSMTSLKQIEFVKNLELQPDIIINIKCSDYDLCQRISGQRQHSTTGYIYTREQWDPEIIESRRKKKKDIPKEGKSEEEEEEEEQEEEEAFMAEMQVVAEIFQHLVQRPEDYLENIEITVKLYKELLLTALEEVMAEHNPQYLIELDGNKSPEELFMTVIERLKYLNMRRAAIITKLQGTEEEMTDIIDTEELFRTVSSYKLIAPRYRWHRSKWARSCPVSLKDGNIYSGAADFTVSLLGKMYCLSSEETLKLFSLNPRPFLLPPMPLPPCKVFLFGPEEVGKTTLANLIAEHFKAKVIDYAKLVQPRFDSAREKLIKDTITEATNTAIKVVKERLLNEMQAKKQ
ncbi:adenylate kinase 9-like, partial [Arvicanthis niloticus]|uniref:adenylate kinase 9-like n=1 Tax=Arvicanthis niloticus TaxID=61156 RepID=UPI00403D15B6